MTELGRAQARALGTALADERIDLCVVTEFERVRETAEIALAGRDVPFLVLPELNDPRYGEFEGGSLVAYREWAWARGPLDAPAGGEHRGEIAGRYARGLRMLARPARGHDSRSSLTRCRSPTFETRPPARRRGAEWTWSSTRRCSGSSAAELERAVGVLEAWAAAPAF